MKPAVLIRCDASAALGRGHLVRCLAVADALRARGDAEPVFAVWHDEAARAAVRAAGHVAHGPGEAGPADEDGWLARLCAGLRPRSLLCDVRTGLRRATLLAIRASGVRVAVLDDPDERRLAADLAAYPPVPEAGRLSWEGFSGRLLIGWEWIVLRSAFARPRAPRTAPAGRPPRLVVSMGGSDPAGLTLLAVDGLAALRAPAEIDLILGPAFAHDAALEDRLRATGLRCAAHRAVEDMPALLGRADLALAAFGMTAYELAALDVPALLFCLTPSHAEAAGALVAAGRAEILGVHPRIDPASVAPAVGRGLAAAARRAPAAPLVDGLGAVRLAGLLAAP